MRQHHDLVPMIAQGLALVCIVWSVAVFLVQALGIYQIFRHHSSPPPDPVSPSLPDDQVPHLSIIRPVKGWEPAWYACLASTFRQAYPRHKLSVYLCVASARDPAVPFLRRLLADFPDVDARLLVEEEDPRLHGPRGRVDHLGPNPKIRNISRAYREAKGDVVWVVDSNVWVSRGVAGRMVDKLCGFLPGGARTTPYKFVHQLPLVVDTTTPDETRASPGLLSYAGGLLEEMFMATTHAKFYSAINTVAVAPCIVGKSNMFRKSHLDRLTDPARNPRLPASAAARGRGLDFFSAYICEDHLIGDLLWRAPLPGFANHGLVLGDLAVQPARAMSVADYVARRVRWLRVRKWTVLLATLVEPGVESLLCCAYLAFAVATLWPHLLPRLGVASAAAPPSGAPLWAAAALAVWLPCVLLWMLVDRRVYRKLHALQSVEVDADTPDFARGADDHSKTPRPPRPFLPWCLAWAGREILALPIWIWAVLLGATVTWRGKTFLVRMDMSVVEVPSASGDPAPATANGSSGSMKTARTSGHGKQRLD